MMPFEALFCAPVWDRTKWLLAAFLANVVVGCVQVAAPVENIPPTPAILSAAGITDLRPHYRARVCGQLPLKASACEELLLRFPDERGANIASAPRNLQTLYRIAFVPGLFNDCLHGVFHPFTDVIESLTEFGFSVRDFRTAGRASSIENAERLAQQLGELEPDPRPFIVVVYSKGLPDVLELLVRYPRAAQDIAAIISVAGVSNGSAVADDLDEFYRRWLAALPLLGCERGSGEEVRDLRRDVRLDWWQRHRSAVRVPIFSLAAVPKPNRVSLLLQQTYDKLAAIDPLNDGQLVWFDSIVTQGYFLGFVNVDHFGIAIPLSQQIPALAFLFHDDVPRTELVRSAIETVAATLEGAGRDQAAPHRNGAVAQFED